MRASEVRSSAPAVEVEHPFWIKVSFSECPTPSQVRALRAADPNSTAETAQAFVVRMRSTQVLKIGPFWLRRQALATARSLVDSGLAASIEQ